MSGQNISRLVCPFCKAVYSECLCNDVQEPKVKEWDDSELEGIIGTTDSYHAALD